MSAVDAEIADLTDFLEPEEDDEAEGGVPWAITDDRGAEWAIRRLAEAREHIARTDAQARAYRAAVDRWVETVTANSRHEVTHFGGLLEAYLRARNETNPKCKSIKLPSGEITSRKVGGGWKVADEDALCAWLSHTHADLIELRPHLLKAEANRVLSVTDAGVTDTEGEIVPGVEIVPEGRVVLIHTDVVAP